MGALLEILERLDLSYHASPAGPYFADIVGLMSIVFGGGFLLFSWKHNRYFLGVTGFLTGCFAGLLFKATILPDGGVSHVLYIAICGVALGVICVLFRRFVGPRTSCFWPHRRATFSPTTSDRERSSFEQRQAKCRSRSRARTLS